MASQPLKLSAVRLSEEALTVDPEVTRDRPEPLVFAPLVGRRVSLRPVTPADYEFLHHLETAPPTGIVYRHRGVTVSTEHYIATLWAQVIAQFVMVDRRNDETIGLVAAFAPDFRNGYAHLAAIFSPHYLRKAWPLEGMDLFLEYVFRVFPFRKLYGDVIDFNFGAFASGAMKTFAVEGRLRAHEYYDGRYWDVVKVAVYRDTWAAVRAGSRQSLSSAIRAAEGSIHG